MVAPSFQTYKVISNEPFLKNGKMYITIEHPNTHNHREVRWYTEKEYERAYGKVTTLSKQEVKEVYHSGMVQNFTIEKKGNKTILRGAVFEGNPRLADIFLWEEYSHYMKEVNNG